MGYIESNTETEKSSCQEQRRLFTAEHALRAESIAKSRANTLMAARLANFALMLQRRRHSHQIACPTCGWLAELGRVA